MSIEYAMTMTDMAASDLNSFSQDTNPPTPVAPLGNDWILCNVTTGQRKLYFVWQRGNSLISTNTNYTLVNGDKYILCDAINNSITINLIDFASGSTITIKKIDSSSNEITIIPPSGKTIDGMNTITLGSQYSSYSIITDGINWFIV